MIFTKIQADRINRGIQTRTTRPAKFRATLGSIHPIQRGNFGSVVGWVRVVGVARVKLGSLSLEDIQAEGFRGLCTFKDHWRQVLGRWQAGLEVVHLTLVLVNRPERNKSQLTLFDEEVRPSD